MAKHNHGFLGGSHTFLWVQGNATVYAYSAVAKSGTPPNNELCTSELPTKLKLRDFLFQRPRNLLSPQA